ncbi:2-dehydro-3-deoxyphosphogluconate aldolase/(4S)-4-hydroxy-2-oxoglutarate aldolase [Agromyces sp. 3263]|uniref:bifunctional 4-hydroxy-2-oxoglutarate aldolase/2-dehydro-3-deoxy-phosphogluconate aldolase n=1 Tax=Agromyces sp. 3263 TaxID=2817750 RepID=UPI00286348D5|nr:bifunctional 4-hydroxy-2-oxoglutarate aldolase/2-dehydro-3-deoxy-phosphogluconate aldolase [Agromyces sp. 3263]MDR6906380.1 2-dehydro-3-deoxyphosphogluconate aldolase/(4S)-4-hydroxy-2-oxoglutarate aldolase [Agromyces sp. 3263]
MRTSTSRREHVIAVLRAPSARRFAEVASVLADAGLSRLEFTLTSDGTLDAITAAKGALPHLAVGCGTARTPADVRRATDAGADFVVSQYHDPALTEAARCTGIEYIPGALTPGEIARAALDADLVKVSPIGPVGGVSYLRELVGPLPDIPLFPTGGVRPDELGAYFDAGAAYVGVSALLLQDALVGGDLRALEERTRAALVPLAALDQTDRPVSTPKGHA